MFIAVLVLGAASVGFLIAAIVGTSQIWQWPAIGCALVGLVLLIVDHFYHRGKNATPNAADPHTTNHHSSHSHRRKDST